MSKFLKAAAWMLFVASFAASGCGGDAGSTAASTMLEVSAREAALAQAAANETLR